MNNNYFRLVLSLILCLCAYSQLVAQCPTTSVTLSTQMDVDDFCTTTYPGCTTIGAGVNITISGANITNLNGLSCLTSTGGDLIINNNSMLTDITGLSNLTSVGGNLEIFQNNILTSLNGLQNVTTVGGNLEVYNTSVLTDLNGLSGLTTVGGNLEIFNTSLLTDLTGLNSLTSVGGNAEIYQNAMLADMTGLNNLGTIGGNLEIYNQNNLTSLNGLNGLTSIGGNLEIYQNSVMFTPDLSGLDNLSTIGGNLEIFNEGSLTSLNGLQNVTSIGGDVDINSNSMLSDCCTLCPLFSEDVVDNTVIGGSITIDFTPAGCANQGEVDACTPCIRCELTDPGAITGTCVGNDDLEFSLNLTGTGATIATTYTVSGAIPFTGTYGTATTFTIPGGANGTNQTITVADANNSSSCTLNITITGAAACLDSDGDGVPDANDDDDDNDGILDTDEETCITCDTTIPAENGSFENHTNSPAAGGSTTTGAGDLPGWQTTASDNQIEIWADGFLSVPAQDGNYFMELNAFEASSLYQELCLLPGTEIEWSICHRGRSGVDVAEINIGATLASTVTQQTMSDDQTAWGCYSGTYIVPAGQATTFFEIGTVSAAGGNPAIGNLIDNFNVTIIEASCCDNDSDGICDRLDTDSDNDGCPDAIEGGGSFTPADLDANDMLAGGVDANGVPTVANGGQGAGDSADAATQGPGCTDPSFDCPSTQTSCTGEPFNLNPAEPGGTYGGTAAPFVMNDILNPTGIPVGSYTLTYTVNGTMSEVCEFTVVLPPKSANAGSLNN